MTTTSTTRAPLGGPLPDAPGVTVNGARRPLAGASAHTTALDWLRDQGLTGAKEGCAEGECGACAVLVARPGHERATEWVAVNACLVPAAALDGQEVVTSEGLGTPDRLHPVQEELAVRGGSQCGYCTPGFVCAMAAEFYRPGRGTEEGAVRRAGVEEHERGPNGFDLHALSGNLCRCTGYRPIRDAAYALGAPGPTDPFVLRSSAPAPSPRPTRVAGAAGEFVRPAGQDQLEPQQVLLPLAERQIAPPAGGDTGPVDGLAHGGGIHDGERGHHPAVGGGA